MVGGLAVVSIVALILSVIALTRNVSPPAPTKADPAAYTLAFVDEALTRYDEEGRDTAVAYYSTEESVDGPWYVFILDESGLVVAHPTADFIGDTVHGPLGVDSTGYVFGPEFLTATGEGKWVSYIFLNRETGRDEVKHAWVVRHGDLFFGSGWYERHIAAPPSKADPAEYTVAFVEEALVRYERDGKDAAVAYYSTEESVDGPWYVFILDESGLVVAHPTADLVGDTVHGPLGVDSTGYVFGPEFLTATEEGKWVSYIFLNRETGRDEVKHTWVVRHGDLFFGSGWYERHIAAPPSKADPAEYTVAFVEEALVRYERDGKDAAVAYYSTEESVDGPWYVFILDESGLVVAHPTADFIGDTVHGPLGVDSTGYVFGPEFLTATEEGKWVSYIFLNRETGRDEVKHTWVVRHGDLFFGSGWYERHIAAPPSKADPAEYTVAFVEEALVRYERDGKDAAVAYYSTEESVDGPWYVFIVDEAGYTIAHPRPEIIGRDPSLRVDATGYFYGDDLRAATEDGTWSSYVFLNPATGAEELKHTWAVKRDDLIFASGWYERLVSP